MCVLYVDLLNTVWSKKIGTHIINTTQLRKTFIVTNLTLFIKYIYMEDTKYRNYYLLRPNSLFIIITK